MITLLIFLNLELVHPCFCFHSSVQTMVLSKVDFSIANLYAQLVPDDRTREVVLGALMSEYDRTVNHVLSVTNQGHLLEDQPGLAQSIKNRFPYLDPLNHLQVRAMSVAILVYYVNTAASMGIFLTATYLDGV